VRILDELHWYRFFGSLEAFKTKKNQGGSDPPDGRCDAQSYEGKAC
jgi:hypothetical protein